jgi:hypothetical protein
VFCIPLPQRTIDVLKIDAEIAEWPFLRDMIIHSPSPLSDVRQLIMEVHTPKYRSEALNASDLAEMNYYLQQLTRPFDSHGGLGFAVYSNRHELQCCGVFGGLLPSELTENCCYDLCLLNTRFLSDVQ